jgi:ubiquinone/menaquinone biosynthesis C-methylase UbiE
MVTATAPTHYVIRGGIEGRERLRLLARVMRPTTLQLLQRAGVAPNMACLDVGCGGGDVTLDLARMVAPWGRAVGTDIDETKLAICRSESGDAGVANAEFRAADAQGSGALPEFDIAYARFLLTHLPDPAAALRHMKRSLVPGGVIVVEDIDFAGSFCYPMHWAYQRYSELYTKAVLRRGGDPNIGPRLPELLREAGFHSVQMNVVQPAGSTGEAKLVSPLTMENIAGAVLEEALASRTEIDEIVDALYALASDERVVMSIPRIVQAWGRLPDGD